MPSSQGKPAGRQRPTGAQLLCAALGVVFLAIGITGLTQSGVDTIGSTPATGVEGTVGGLGGSALMSLVHIGMGVLGLLAALTNSGARVIGVLGTLAFIALTAYGIVALIDGRSGEPLGVRWPQVVLHAAALVVVMLIVRLATRRSRDGVVRDRTV